MSKAYPSNLTRDQYEFLKDLLPEAKSGGRPRTVDLWEVLNAIFYLLVEGVRWRSLPGDFPAWQTVYTYFRTWRRDGTWLEIHDRLREWTRIEAGRHPSPSEAIIDSQSVKSAAMVIWADGGFSGDPFLQWVMDCCRWIVQVVLRPEQTKGFVLLKKRWVVERTFGWLMGCRRLVRDYERLPETSETLIYLAMIRIMVRRLA